jgi:hypothetical protein
MDKNSIKKYTTLGCCGLDCGLCPRYYTIGTSRCPGCGGPDFFEKLPSCSYITCCVKNKNYEVCSECNDFPCSKFENWLENGGEYDSFLTHKKAKFNHEFIQTYGLKNFIEQQKKRITLLENMLNNYDDGRSKSYYCIATTLLPISDLDNSIQKMEKKFQNSIFFRKKEKSKILKKFLNESTTKNNIELKLRKKKNKIGKI